MNDDQLAALWRRHFEVYDGVVYAYIEEQRKQAYAREQKLWRRARHWRPMWWRAMWLQVWHHAPRLAQRLNDREERRHAARIASNPAAITLAQLGSKRHMLSHARFAPAEARSFAASDPLDDAYVGVPLEADLVRDRRERGGEWA